MVDDAIAEVKKQEVHLPVEAYIEALKGAISEMLEARKAADPDAPT